MSANIAAAGAIILSICTVLGCLIFIPMVYNQISSIGDEIQLDVDEFNVKIFRLQQQQH